jgi:GntR family transcriptional repressor for pyruvate dehydrogenase complex
MSVNGCVDAITEATYRPRRAAEKPSLGLAEVWSDHGEDRNKTLRLPVSQSTVNRIQAMILAGKFAAGQRLPSERDLAEQLSVSRASLREALSILETLGLVRIEPHRGTFVTVNTNANEAEPVSLGSGMIWRFASRYTLREVYQFRLLAESYAALLASMAVTDDQIDELRRIVRKHKEATRNLDFVGSSQADFELHHRIMLLSNNRIFADLHDNYQAVFLESQRVPVARHRRVWETVDEHEKIVQAIARRDPEGAEYYMRLHITRAADRVGIALSDTPQAGAAQPAVITPVLGAVRAGR